MKKGIFVGHKYSYMETIFSGRMYACYDDGDELEIQKVYEDSFFCNRISDGLKQWVERDEIREIMD